MQDEKDKKIRLFTGVSLDAASREYVADLQEKLAKVVDDVRWVPRENLHVTLKFLGYCPAEMVTGILDAMQGASKFLPLRLRIGGVGGFPSRGSASIIWVGAQDLDERLMAVYRHLSREFKKLGFEREKRRYRPHITVGRSRGRRQKVRIPEDIGGSDDSVMLDVETIVLYRSELGRGPARYSVLGEIGTRNG